MDCRRNGRDLGNRYRPGSGPIWLDDLRCTGSESRLSSCRHNGWGRHNCRHREDVSISCTANSDRSSTTSSSSSSSSSTSSSTTTTTTTSTSKSSSSTTSTPPTNGLHSEFSFSPLRYGFSPWVLQVFWMGGRKASACNCNNMSVGVLAVSAPK